MNAPLKIHIIPILKDNYAYIIEHVSSGECSLVDPGEATPILDYLQAHKLSLKEIWITHFHSDHIGGVIDIKEHTNCKILGPAKETDKLPFLDQTLQDADLFSFHEHSIKILEFPGHTLGHIGYWLLNDNLLFCGDTLFSLGCGFLFEGTYEQMWDSLCKIRALPEDTLIYCGHEYSQANAQFALSLDPNNKNLKAYSQKIDEKRKHNLPTMPMLLKTEIETNPFLRADMPTWQELLHIPSASTIEIFKEMRERKNTFKA